MLDDRTRTPDPHIAPFALWSYDDSPPHGPPCSATRPAGPTSRPPPPRPGSRTPTGLPPAYIEVGQIDVFRDEDLTYRVIRHAPVRGNDDV